MDQIIQAIAQLREDPNNNKYSDEELISIYNLGSPSFQNDNTGILSNINFPEFNLPNFSNIKNLGGQITGGLLSAVTGIPFFGPIIGNIAQPAVSDVMAKNYMAENYGLDNIGRVNTGIMQGYNPVNMMGVGMIESIDKRLDNIRNRKLPQTKASQAKIAELEKLQNDLIANEKANTYAPVVTQQQKQLFSGSGDGVPDRPDKSGATGINAGGFTNPGRGSYGPHFARGGIVSL